MNPSQISCVLLVAAACGGAPRPEARLADTKAAIRGAEEVGAKDVPKAALHLKLAQEQHDKAVALINDDNNERAEYVLMRAEADAELAVALAREANQKAEAEKLRDQVEELKKRAAK